MPSRNSINKPKDSILRNSHAARLGKRRNLRSKHLTRSSTSRYNTTSNPSPTESKQVALFNGTFKDPVNITNKRLSNKRAKKLARNQRYISKRSNPEEIMEIEKQQKVNSSQFEEIKQKLFDMVNNNVNFKVGADAEGTTIGNETF